MQNNKILYRQFCETHSEIPVFLSPWWMDAVSSNGDWDVLISFKQQQIAGVWVYYHIQKGGFKLIIQPQLTQMSGIWINHNCKPDNQGVFNYEKDIITDLSNQMQGLNHSYLDQNLYPNISNWLPLYWNGFKQTTRYTYRINELHNIDEIEQSFRPSKRAHIKKAQKHLKVNFNISPEIFYDLVEQSFFARNRSMDYSKDFFTKLYYATQQKEQGAIVGICDEQNTIHAAIFLVWDNEICYNLVSMINPESRNSGASSLAFLESIRYAASKSKIFDFEGSMNQQIEQSFRELGGTQTPYSRIIKENSLSFKLIHFTYKKLKSKVRKR